MVQYTNHVLKRLSAACAVGIGLLVLTIALTGMAQSEPLSPSSLLVSAARAAAAPVAPQVITKTWENLGLYGATVSAIAIDPVSNAPTGTVFIGSTSGSGFYRSLDGGLTWEGISGYGSVQALAVNTVGGIVWAKGESGFIVSTDGGNTWSAASTPHSWGSLVISGSLTILGSGSSVEISLDGGTK